MPKPLRWRRSGPPEKATTGSATATAHQHCIDQGHDIDAVYELNDEHMARLTAS